MTTPTIPDYLKYAQLQMAAEALYDFNAITDADELIPGKKLDVPTDGTRAIQQAWLTDGNKHASFFVASEAEKFTNAWEVVSHISNTSTGFSGTLFKHKTTNEFVISMRSTEFIDDAARDSRATNELEIKERGWAFGQISDMEKWYSEIRDKITGPLTATGYSLGGHLATAFNFLHGQDTDVTLSAVYTFNGAGVGRIGPTGTVTTENLTAMIGYFSGLRKQAEDADGLSSLLQSALGKTTYAALKAQLAQAGGVPSGDMLEYIQLTLENKLVNQAELSDLQLLRDAMANALSVTKEANRVSDLTSGKGEKPAPIPIGNIAGASLDYQIAMLSTHTKYQTQARSIAGGAWSIYIDKAYGKGQVPIKQYDVVGTETTKEPTGMVANSQWHYDRDIRQHSANIERRLAA